LTATAETIVTPGLAEDVWRVTTPLPFRPSRVHAYLARLPDGWMLVDGGLGTDEAWRVLEGAVLELAGGWSAIRLHVVTHMHMDHVGLAARVREASGAPVAMGALDAERMAHAAADPEDEARYRAALLRSAGAPNDVLARLEAQRAEAAALAPPVRVDVKLAGDGGALPGAPGWRWLWTPGHTAGHVSLHRPADGTVIAGDAVLASITPTLGVNRQRSDPVGDYLEALGRLEAAAPSMMLAGHGSPVPPERLASLRTATLEEAERVAELVGAEPTTAWTVSVRRHPGDEMPLSTRMLALRETRAHLDRLSGSAGRLSVRAADGVDWFTRAG